MAENYKHLYEQIKKMLTMYQDKLIPGFRKQIEELEARSKWIPVTERLPEGLKNVLAYTDVGSFAETAHWTGYRWEKTWDFEVLYGVTHWMPLPEPPKED